MPTLLWWGRFDPSYSRNRVVRRLLESRGWRVRDFHPLVCAAGDLQASIQRLVVPDAVWVPCFRQRDVQAAARWARRHGIPLIFDPLISAYDKQVDERQKFPATSGRARRLLAWERVCFGLADRVVADTPAHADYFHAVLGVPRARLAVLMVGAEEALFQPCPVSGSGPLEALFYGSFIPLQGPQVIVDAARLFRGPDLKWTLLGAGPLRAACERSAADLPMVRFEDWLPYPQLPARICRADILLGVFGATPKAGRVIPNKVYQALACARPLVTRSADAYPQALSQDLQSGIAWVPAGDPQALAERVATLADRALLANMGSQAGLTSERYFSTSILAAQLDELLDGLLNETVR